MSPLSLRSAIKGAWIVLLLLIVNGKSVAEDTHKITLLQERCHQLIVDQYKLAEAKPVVEQLLALTLKLRGEAHQDSVVALHWSGYLAYKAGNYSEAARIWERSLVVQEKLPKQDMLWYARTLHVLGRAYREQSDFQRAEVVLQRARELREKELGANHPETVEILKTLGRLYEMQAQALLGKFEFPQAEAVLKRALALREQAFGSNDNQTLQVAKDLGRRYLQMGDFAKAEQLFLRLLKIYETQGSEAELNLAETLFSLADLYLDIRDLDKAEPLLARAMRTFEKQLGPDHSWMGSCLVQLGALRTYQGDPAAAEAAYQQSLRLLEKLHGPESIELYWPLHAVAELRLESKRLSEAEACLQRILKIIQSKVGSEHPRIIHTLNMLGNVHEGRGDFPKARDCFAKACRLALRQPEATEYSAEQCCKNLAELEFMLGHPEAALATAGQIQNRREKRMANVLSFTTERQRLDYLTRYGSGGGVDLWATMGAVQPLARAILRTKGVVLDSLLEDRLLADSNCDLQQLQQRGELIGMKRRLAHLRLNELSLEADPRATDSPRRAETEGLAQQAEALESALAGNTIGLGRSRRALSTRVEQVQEALPEHAALVEFLRYKRHEVKGARNDHYGALIICHQGEPYWVPLGNADAIEKNLKLYQHLVRGKSGDDSLPLLLRELHGQLWAPLARGLPARVNQIILCPDAQLNFLSFATLLNSSNHFLGEEYSVSYVSSGRDLLAAGTSAPLAAELLIWANPDFGGSNPLSPVTPQLASAETTELSRVFRGLELRPLPGAEREGRSLKNQAEELGFAQAILRVGKDATEAELARVQSPDVLHLATHGFVLADSTSRVLPTKARTTNPMLRSGLALAGARRTLETWARGEAVLSDDDGILTAEEIGCLNLRNTWLVVLSACDTGLGQSRAGEGMLGLRRGFVQAGAQNLLLTLWPIDDDLTADFMPEFYAAMNRTGDAAESLATVQRAWLRRLRLKKGVAEACQIAGPFILSFQGRPAPSTRAGSISAATERAPVGR